MPKITDTYTRSYQACGAILREEGRFPTIARVRDRIGTNSPPLIKRAINDWTAALAVEIRERLQRPGVPASLLNATEALWRMAQDEAERSLTGQRATLVQERQVAEQNMSKAQIAYAALEQEMEKERQQTAQERQSLQARFIQQNEAFRELEAINAQLMRELVDMREVLAEHSGALAEAKAAEARERADWQGRFEQEHQWYLRRIQEEKDQLRAGVEGSIAKLKMALQSAHRQIDDLNRQREYLIHKIQEWVGEQRALRQENERLHDIHEMLSQTIMEQQKQLQAQTAMPSGLKVPGKSARPK